MGSIRKIRLQNGKEYEVSDWTSSVPLWSTVELGTAAFNILSAFSYGQGGIVPGSIGPRQSTEVDTNLDGEGSRLPQNQAFILYSLMIDCFLVGTYAAIAGDNIDATVAPDVGLQDMLRLQRDLIVSTRITDVKEYLRAPLGYWPAGSGVHHVQSGSAPAAAADRVAVAYNGGVSPSAARRLAAPLYIGPGDAFSVDFQAGPGSVTNLSIDPTAGRIRIRTTLDGLYKRPWT